MKDDAGSLVVLSAVESFADGELTQDELRGLVDAIGGSFGDVGRYNPLQDVQDACRSTYLAAEPLVSAGRVSQALRLCVRAGLLEARQVSALREVVRFPTRPGLSQAWRTPAALLVACGCYEARDLPSGHLDPARFAVLSDAFEEAGCTDPDVLSHLRSPGPHVRGCWALDLVLGKA